jgi:hypothetical protein
MHWGLLVLALAAGCGSNLPAQSFIDKLRVLMVQADPAEPMPGQLTHLTALAVEPPVPTVHDGPVLAIDALWLSCSMPPGATSTTPCGITADTPGVPPLCADQPSAPLCVVGSGLELGYTPDGSAVGGNGTGQRLLTVVVSDRSDDPAATRGDAVGCLLELQQHNGIPSHPDRCVIALKRLPISTLSTRNQNPLLTSFTLEDPSHHLQSLVVDGATFAADATKTPTFKLHVERASDSAEIKPGTSDYEALSISWYTTSGKLDGGRSAFDPPGCASQLECATHAPVSDAKTSWIAPTAAKLAATSDDQRAVEFWVVIRDDRGGVSFLRGKATAQ